MENILGNPRVWMFSIWLLLQGRLVKSRTLTCTCSRWTSLCSGQELGLGKSRVGDCFLQSISQGRPSFHALDHIPSRSLMGDDALALLNIPMFMVLRSCPQGQRYQTKLCSTTYGESVPSNVGCMKCIIHRMLPAIPRPFAFVLVRLRCSLFRRTRPLVLIFIISGLAPRSLLVLIPCTVLLIPLFVVRIVVSRSFVDLGPTNGRASISWLQSGGKSCIGLKICGIQASCISFFVSDLAESQYSGTYLMERLRGCLPTTDGSIAQHQSPFGRR